MAFASSAKGLSESGTGARAHLFRSEEASTPPERVTRKPCGSRYFERTSMGGLEPPTPAFGGQCSIQLSYTDDSATVDRVAIEDCKPIQIDRRGAEHRCEGSNFAL